MNLNLNSIIYIWSQEKQGKQGGEKGNGKALQIIIVTFVRKTWRLLKEIGKKIDLDFPFILFSGWDEY